MGSKMYLYLKCFYEQWCSGQDDADIIERSEVFIDIVHDKFGYDKDRTRQFLYREPWFKYK